MNEDTIIIGIIRYSKSQTAQASHYLAMSHKRGQNVPAMIFFRA